MRFLIDVVNEIRAGLSLPTKALESLILKDATNPRYKSSFHIDCLAQSSVATSALSAALVHSLRTGSTVPKVDVPFHHSCYEFKADQFYTIDGVPPKDSIGGTIGGLQELADGHVRIHDSFTNHRYGALKLLGLGKDASREKVAREVKKWKNIELEDAAANNKLAICALRNYAEWDALRQAAAVSQFPIITRKISDAGSTGPSERMKTITADRCLRGIRVLELSRVVAAPVAGKTLAAHGADVLWVTSPNLPDLPSLDKNLSRGKRTIQIDLNIADGAGTMRDLVKEGDVFLQSYRPGSLAAKGSGPADLAALYPGLVYASLSAFGPSGPWSSRRGFDSLVQTCSGMNESEAEKFGEGEVARVMPCQALDHAGGYFLATGIAAALYKRAIEGGSWEVQVSLAAVQKYLRSLGQKPGREGFEHNFEAEKLAEVPAEYFEERSSGFGMLRAIKHAANVEGLMPGWNYMPKPLGRDEAIWL